MTGLATELLYAGRSREGSRLASEQMALLESIGDPTLTMGLAFVAFANWFDAGEFGEILRWSQTVIDLADGDPAKGAGFGVGSPLAVALAWRGVARWWLGRPGWRQDLHDAVAMARHSDPTTLACVVAWTYGLAMQYGVLRADDSAVRASEEAVQTAERTSNDVALSLAKYTLGVALLNRDAAADRHRGLELMVQARDICARACSLPGPGHRVVGRPGEGQARRPRCCHCGDAPSRGRAAPGRTARRMAFGAPAFWWRRCWSVAPRATWPKPRRRSTGWRTCRQINGSAMREITLLRLRALLARARGDDVAYRDYRDRYRAMATSLGFEGHMAWAEAMV